MGRVLGAPAAAIYEAQSNAEHLMAGYQALTVRYTPHQSTSIWQGWFMQYMQLQCRSKVVNLRLI